MHCTTCAIGISCHVSANGTVLPSMVLRYWHDYRVDKGTNQHENGFALAMFIAVVRLRYTSTYSHPTLGFATARPPLNAECCVGPAPCPFGNASPSLCCAHWSAASVLAILHQHRFATDKARLPWSDAGHAESYPSPLYHYLPYLPFLPRFRLRTTTPGHVLGLWINPWVLWWFIPHCLLSLLLLPPFHLPPPFRSLARLFRCSKPPFHCLIASLATAALLSLAAGFSVAYEFTYRCWRITVLLLAANCYPSFSRHLFGFVFSSILSCNS